MSTIANSTKSPHLPTWEKICYTRSTTHKTSPHRSVSRLMSNPDIQERLIQITLRSPHFPETHGLIPVRDGPSKNFSLLGRSSTFQKHVEDLRSHFARLRRTKNASTNSLFRMGYGEIIRTHHHPSRVSRLLQMCNWYRRFVPISPEL